MPRRIRKIATVTALVTFGLVVAAIAGGLGYRVYRHSVIARATTIDPAVGVDEQLFTTIGGIEQWIAIRGQDRRNPALLFVHGGPGIAASPYPRTVLFSWTHDFTLVLWDQRGAGKTFGRSGPVGSSVTVERMAQDGVEVAAFARARLGKPKIVLVGLSWGSMLGARMAKMRPDLFYAFVGTGQSVNQRKYKILAYEQLLAEARARDDRRAISELTENGPPPYTSVSKASVHTKWANAYEPGQPSGWGLASLVLFHSDVGLFELRDYIRGIVSSEDHFRDAEGADDLESLGSEFALPFFVFQGAADNVTPVGPVRNYIDAVKAPRKDLVLIPDAGHNAVATRSEEFLRLLRARVRPLAH
jgi:pimeloyl-ACP methyl ester carboxylesterase